MAYLLQKQISLALTALLLLLSSATFAASHCANLAGCEKKFCEIKKQLNAAANKGNERKADGLEKALKQAQKHCTNAGLKQDLLEEIEDAKRDIAGYEAELKEAQAHNDAEKTAKLQRKLAEEQELLQRLKDELATLE